MARCCRFSVAGLREVLRAPFQRNGDRRWSKKTAWSRAVARGVEVRRVADFDGGMTVGLAAVTIAGPLVV